MRNMVVCPTCSIEMCRVQIGVAVEAMVTDGSYQLWMADVVGCKGCGLEIITGFGNNPICEHFHVDYADLLAAHQPKYRFWVNAQEKAAFETRA